MKVALEAIPGEYYVRAIEEWPDERAALGKLTITDEQARIYHLDLPGEEQP